MSSDFGKKVKISIFGQSHSEAIGVVIDGLPVGEEIDLEEVQKFMERRAPGRNAWSTPRKEADMPENFDKADVKAIFTEFAANYDENDDNNTWFEKIKAISEKLGFASDMKAYKANPENYKGSVGDVSMLLRIAVTGRTNSPDMHEIMRILGKERVLARLEKAAEAL